MKTRNIISFYELTETWQNEAISNLDDMAKDTYYLEPLPENNPKEHILWDLSECMRSSGVHDGFSYNATITISNNSAMLLNINDGFETAEITFI
jgi:hypothetical protein